MKKRFLSILLALSMVLTFLPLNAVTAFAEDANKTIVADGICGDRLTWTLDSNGILTISGTGAMGDYIHQGDAPWSHTAEDGLRVKQVILEKGITSISNGAFSLCSNLTDITIPYGVTSIGGWAFNGCLALKEIALPDSLVSINTCAFQQCTSLISIVIPDSVTSISGNAFNSCENLTTVKILGSVSEISERTFYKCSSLTTITIPGSVKSIGESAFYKCSSLTTIRYAGTQEQWEALKPSISSTNNSTFLSLGPTFVAPLTVKNGTFTYKNAANEEVTGKTGVIPVGTEVTVTFNKAAFADSSSKFSYWDIDGLDYPNTYQNQESFTFIMPDHAVTLEAMTQDESIEDPVSEVLGTAAMVTTAVAGTAVLAYTGYQIGTELYLTYLLPTGAAIPANTAQLAQLLWTEAGKPAPAAVLPEDAAETQQAMAWAVEQNLLPADKAPDASVSRIEVIRTWKKVQSGKVG